MIKSSKIVIAFFKSIIKTVILIISLEFKFSLDFAKTNSLSCLIRFPFVASKSVFNCARFNSTLIELALWLNL